MSALKELYQLPVKVAKIIEATRMFDGGFMTYSSVFDDEVVNAKEQLEVNYKEVIRVIEKSAKEQGINLKTNR